MCLQRNISRRLQRLQLVQPLPIPPPLQASRHAHRIAAHVDELTTSSTVDFLQALPWDDAAFYAKESNLVIPGSRSQEVFTELTHRYGFVGGTEEEYAAYFNRDLPADMWSWCVESEVQAVAGFSVVAKKPDEQGFVALRKLLMCCLLNYVMADARNRS